MFMGELTVKKAMDFLRDEMKSDGCEPGSYAHSWHCNIAMMCYDAIRSRRENQYKHKTAIEIGNDAASRFMKLCFDVETKQ